MGWLTYLDKGLEGLLMQNTILLIKDMGAQVNLDYCGSLARIRDFPNFLPFFQLMRGVGSLESNGSHLKWRLRLTLLCQIFIDGLKGSLRTKGGEDCFFVDVHSIKSALWEYEIFEKTLLRK